MACKEASAAIVRYTATDAFAAPVDGIRGFVRKSFGFLWGSTPFTRFF
jgi:hypothetical protein